MPQLARPSTVPEAFSAFADIDRHFANFISRFGGGQRVALAAACLSAAVRQGHICLNLGETAPDSADGADTPWPSVDEWRRELRASRAVGEVSGSGASAETNAAERTPLVLDAAGRLYLRRYFEYEQSLAATLRRRAAAPPDSTPGTPCEDDQQTAIETALSRRFTVISGGPGTGKTTTVVRILGRILQDAPGCRVALAAPTGKAAARLEQTIRENWSRFAPAGSDANAALSKLPRATTVHRLLGARRDSPLFRHHAGNPLGVDLLVLDETSMVPLPLMAKLFNALPERTRVILLGDRDQLASVDPGSVLADIADAAGAPGTPLCQSLVSLRKNYRFGGQSVIQRLSETVRAGDAVTALDIVRGPDSADFHAASLPTPSSVAERLRPPVLDGFSPYLQQTDPAGALAAFNRFRILCAVRHGPYGVAEINRQVRTLLHDAGLIRGTGALYAGLPVLVTRNDYQLSLFNGDVGILLPDPAAAGESVERPLWAWFPGQTPEEPLRRIAPAQLPVHETAFATTIHKSQGSEFDTILLILPQQDAPILTRELVYTGLTRARTRVALWFEESAFARAVTRRNRRTSGLRDALL